jgi:methylmalonyl-CoA mutase N-terminal domain/subunit
MASIDEHGGVVAGIQDGSLEQAIADSAYDQQRRIESGARTIVGVNRFHEESGDEAEIEPFTVGSEVLERQLERLRCVRDERDDDLVRDRLARVEAVARRSENTMPAIVEAVRAYATTGEISRALERVFGRHQPSSVI